MWLRFVLVVLPVVLIIVVALAAYSNAWPNTLVHDDKYYTGSERFTELSNIPRYFTESVWASSGVSNRLYRPLLLVSITLDARAYGDWVSGYHLTNIFLHVLVSILVYGFLLQLLRMSNGQSGTESLVALMTALIFAVHPVYTEVVNSIHNRSEMLVALGGLAGLLWFLQHMSSRPGRAWVGLGLAYLPVLFCKESGIVLPGLAVVLVLVLTPGNWVARVRKSLPVFWLLIPLVLYLALRSQVLAPVEITGSAEVSGGSSASGLDVMLNRFRIPGGKRLMNIAGLWYESFKIMMWPFPLQILHDGISRFTQIVGLALHLALILAALYQFKHKRYGLIIGLLFFYIAMLPASRFTGDPGLFARLAERYLYFPSVGLAITLAFGLRYLARRFDILLAASVVLLAIIVLTPVTWARNTVWASEIQLFESEYNNGNHTKTVLAWLTAAYLRESEFQRAVEICDRHNETQKELGNLSTHCATAYSQLGRLDEAERAYLIGTTQKKVRAIAHANLGGFYLTQNRWQDAKKHFEMAVEAEKLPPIRAFRQGHMLVRLYPQNRKKLLEAKVYFEHALELQPGYGPAHHWLKQVNRTLGEP